MRTRNMLLCYAIQYTVYRAAMKPSPKVYKNCEYFQENKKVSKMHVPPVQKGPSRGFLWALKILWHCPYHHCCAGSSLSARKSHMWLCQNRDNATDMAKSGYCHIFSTARSGQRYQVFSKSNATVFTAPPTFVWDSAWFNIIFRSAYYWQKLLRMSSAAL